MAKLMISGCLAVVLAGSCLSGLAQLSPEQRGNLRKHTARSGVYSVSDQDRIWIVKSNAQQAEIDKMQVAVDEMQRKADKELVRHLIVDLEQKNIIMDEKGLWIALTGDKMIVNGKKMSRATYSAFKRKYIRKAGFGIFYGNPLE